MKPVTKEQISAVHTVLHRHGLMHDKRNIIDSFTNGRSTSSKDLTFDEAKELLAAFNTKPAADVDPRTPMIKKLFKMAHQLGWIKKQKVVSGSSITEKNDNSQLYGWVNQYGYLKKDLKKYTYSELPKLISQLEFGAYKSYIAGNKNGPEQDVF